MSTHEGATMRGQQDGEAAVWDILCPGDTVWVKVAGGRLPGGGRTQVGRSVGIAVTAPLGVGVLSRTDPT